MSLSHSVAMVITMFKEAVNVGYYDYFSLNTQTEVKINCLWKYAVPPVMLNTPMWHLMCVEKEKRGEKFHTLQLNLRSSLTILS